MDHVLIIVYHEVVPHRVVINVIYSLGVPQILVQDLYPIFVFRWLRKDGSRAFAKLYLTFPAF